MVSESMKSALDQHGILFYKMRSTMHLEDYFVNEKGSNHQLLRQNHANLI